MIIQVVGKYYKTKYQFLLCLVADLPKSRPRILGVESSYHVGDKVTATCVSPRSYPPSVLTWYINNNSADTNYVSSQSEGLFHFNNQSESRTELAIYAEHILRLRPFLQKDVTTLPEIHQRRDPALYSVVKLRFPIREKHLVSGNRYLSVKCTASITGLYWRSNEVNTWIRPMTAWRFSGNIGAVLIVRIPQYLLVMAHIISCISQQLE